MDYTAENYTAENYTAGNYTCRLPLPLGRRGAQRGAGEG